MLSVRHINTTLGAFSLEDISFDVEEGGYFVLLGPSGVGKTVLLEALAGLVRIDTGQILLDGADLTTTPIRKRRMGLVYQDQALFPHLNVFHNIAYGLHGRCLGHGEKHRRVNELAEAVGVTELLARHPSTLSGGEAQRVALARALATEPRCLLLDEPLSSLDRQARGDLRALLRTLNRQGHTVVHVTHDFEEAVSLATHVGVMEGGAVVQTGTPEDIFQHPKSEFIARFVGIRNFYHGYLEATQGGLSMFVAHGLALRVLTQSPAGPGCLILRSEDIALSHTRSDTSAQNNFLGVVIDIAPSGMGIEVTVDIGIKVVALITRPALAHLGLHHGQKIWLGFKATAARFLED